MNLNAMVIDAVQAHLDNQGISQANFARQQHFRQSWLNRRMLGITPWKLNEIERLQDAGVEIPGIAVGHHADSVVIDDPALLCEER